MKEYKCQRCGYITDKKSSFKNHFLRKKICEPNIQDLTIDQLLIMNKIYIDPNSGKNIETIEDKYMDLSDRNTYNEKTKKYYCPYCERPFSQKNTLYTHIKNKCNAKKMVDKSVEELFSLMLQVKKLENNNSNNTISGNLVNSIDAENIKESFNTTNNNTTNNNTTNNTTNNNTTNNITINNFCHENNKHLYTKKYINKIVRGCDVNMIKNYIHYCHFDPDFPENHNVKVTNIRGNYGMIYIDDWEYVEMKSLITDIFNKGIGYFDDLKDQVEPNQEKEIIKLDNKYDNDDKEIRKDIKMSLLRETKKLKNKN